MKRLFVFLPAVLWGALYTFLGIISGFESLSIGVWFLVALMTLAGIFLFLRKWWGSFLGMIPGGVFILMGTRETGQIINEMPIGIALVLFYLICGILVLIDKVKISR